MPLNTHLQPFRDYQLARKFAWNPETIDLAQDQRDWATLDPGEQDVLKNLLAMFLQGEESVATDLTPMLWAVGQMGGRREEEMFLTTQLFDESQHVEFFSRWIDAVSGPYDPTPYWGPSYRGLFLEELPQALRALLHDQAPPAMARALLTYHVMVEGTLAETGYQAAFTACRRRGVLPGLTQGFEYIKRDESRHIAYGLYALQNLIKAHPDLWEMVVTHSDALLRLAVGVIPEALERYGDNVPFGLSLDEFSAYAVDQFSKRFARLEAVAPTG